MTSDKKLSRIGRDTFPEYILKRDDGCWVWTGYCGFFGYGRYRSNLAHRVAYERAKGPIPPGMCICHSCDNPPCVNPDHLWLGTHADNVRDMERKGRARKTGPKCDRSGENNPRAKLTWEEVRTMRRLRLPATELGRRFGVTGSTAAGIVAGRTWKEAR